MKILILTKLNYATLNHIKLEATNNYYHDPSQTLKQNLENFGHQVCLKTFNFSPVKNIISESHLFNPHIIYIGSYFEYYDEFLSELKSRLPSAKVLAWIACPIPKNTKFKNIDFIFSSLPTYVKAFREQGIKSMETIFGFPGELHVENIQKSYDIGFIGGIDGLLPYNKFHKRRTALIKFLSNHTDIHKWGYGFNTENKLINSIKRLVNGKKLYKNYHGPIWGIKMFKTIASFHININCHAEIAGQYAVNNRIFETTGMGTLLLTDHQLYLNKYFEPNLEAITYKSNEECLEKISFLLKNPEELKAITLAGQKRTLNNYTVKHFCDKFIYVAESLI